MNFFGFWKVSDNPPKNADCFIVLSYASRNPSTPTKLTQSCIKIACEWWKKFPNAKLIMSTGDNQHLGVSNARIMADYAISIGVPKDRIFLEDKSADTWENLLFSNEILKKNNFKHPTLVCFDLHMRRVLKVAKKMKWKNFYWLSAYSKGDSSYDLRHSMTISRFTTLIYEILSMFYFKIKGQI